MLLLWILNGLDVLTTTMVLDRGGSEANPLMQPFADSWIQLAAIKYLVLGLYSSLRPPRWVTGTLCVWYTLVVGWNFFQMVG